MRPIVAAALVSCLILTAACQTVENPPVLDGPYLGQEPPGAEPVLFAPGLVSTGRQEVSIAFSPDGNDMYLHVTGPTFTPRYFLHSRLDDAGWSDLHEVTFFGPQRQDSYPFPAPDGERIFFNSSRPYDGAPERRHREIWYVDRVGSGWTNPVRIGVGEGTFPSVAANGNLYFNGGTDASGSDIYFSKFDDGNYSEPVRLANTVNSLAGDFHPFIAPDESYLMFDSNRENDNLGSNDIYISFRNDDGTWSEAQNLGETINTEYADLRPFVTADGKYLFFVSNRVVEPQHSAAPLSSAEVYRILDRPGNGLQDIYWVGAEVVPRRPGAR